ncbi:MAG: hypothetical protein ABSE70_11960 [Candidatus Limnocylindrales bacterium]
MGWPRSPISAYLAPEGPADERSDLYSLGVIAFEMLTGVVPFEGRTYQEVILRHVREAPDLDKLPPEARPTVGWLLAKDPAERPQRSAELLPVLYGAAEVPAPAPAAQPALAPAPALGMVGPSSPASTNRSISHPSWTSRRPPVWATIGALLASLVVGGTVLVGWSGVVQVPIVSSLFGMDHARDLGMQRDQQALEVFCAQYGITRPSAPANYTLSNPHHWSGSVAIDGMISEAALGSLPEFNSANPYLSGINFRIHDGYVEMAAFVKNVPGYPFSGPVYGQFSVERTGPASVQVHISHLDLGHIGVPGDIVRQVEDELNVTLNQMIVNSGVTFDALELREGEIYYKGTWPKTITADPPAAVDGAFGGSGYLVSARRTSHD